MYIHPILCGVIGTLLVELLLVIVAALVSNKKKK